MIKRSCIFSCSSISGPCSRKNAGTFINLKAFWINNPHLLHTWKQLECILVLQSCMVFSSFVIFHNYQIKFLSLILLHPGIFCAQKAGKYVWADFCASWNSPGHWGKCWRRGARVLLIVWIFGAAALQHPFPRSAAGREGAHAIVFTFGINI